MKRRIVASLVAALLLGSILVAPSPRVQAQEPSSQPAVDARFQIVWPHDEQGNVAPVETAGLVNVEVYLFERGTLNPVSCSFPNTVSLHWARNAATRGGVMLIPAQDELDEFPYQADGAVGQRVMRNIDGKTFPAWVFNDIPAGRSTMYFLVEVEGTDFRTNVCAHTTDARTILPYPPSPWKVGGTAPTIIDALIQIVWPHDAQGNPQPVTEANLVNIGVALAEHPFAHFGAWTSVGASFNRTVRILRSLNDGFLEPVKVADQISMIVSGSTSGTISWPRWVFNDVDVSAAQDPFNKYYFAVQVDGTETHTTIWAHGADARTYFPQKDVPARSCAG